MNFLLHAHTHSGGGGVAAVWETLLHTLTDTVLILPFMFLAFICIGILERGAGRKMVSVILAADKVGPLAGGLLGALPSCGFSACGHPLAERSRRFPQGASAWPAVLPLLTRHG